MFQFDITHLASAVLGAALGALALWAYSRGRGQPVLRTEGELRDELNLSTQIAGIGVWRLDIATRTITSDPTLRRILGVEGEIVDGIVPGHSDHRGRVNNAVPARQAER